MNRALLICVLLSLSSTAAFGTGVAYVAADNNADGQRVSIEGWEFIASNDWYPVTVQLDLNGGTRKTYKGECTADPYEPNGRRTILCRGQKEFPLAGSTFIGRWERKRDRNIYVCTTGCARKTPKRIYEQMEEPEGDPE